MANQFALKNFSKPDRYARSRTVTHNAAAVKAFTQAGQKVMFVGKDKINDAAQFDSWSDVKLISTGKSD